MAASGRVSEAKAAAYNANRAEERGCSLEEQAKLAWSAAAFWFAAAVDSRFNAYPRRGVFADYMERGKGWARKAIELDGDAHVEKVTARGRAR